MPFSTSPLYLQHVFTVGGHTAVLRIRMRDPVLFDPVIDFFQNSGYPNQIFDNLNLVTTLG
jgi:hypothetical protein